MRARAGRFGAGCMHQALNMANNIMNIANIMLELVGNYPNYFRLWKLAQLFAHLF